MSDVSVNEDAGTARVLVTQSDISAQTVTVDYATSNGTATAGADYTAASGTLTFSPGQTTKFIDVSITNDDLNESDETFTVTISNAVNATIADATATGTILNDDAVPSLVVNDVIVNEDAGTATFTVTQSAVLGQTVTVDYATSNGTATAGADYTAASGTLTFNAGDTTKTFNVTITNDTSDEVDETYTVSISNPINATIANATATGTITDNDVTVDQTDDDNTATGFGGGSHNGTIYENEVLTLNTATFNSMGLHESWTPKWDNLVGYWKMDESSWSGTADEVKDYSGNGNHGGRVGDTTTTSDAKIGSGAGIFDGGGDYISVSPTTELDGFASGVTVALWVKLNTLTGTRILEKSSESYSFSYTSGKWVFKARNASRAVVGATSGVDATTSWTHLVGTYDGAKVRIYVNGVFEDASNQTGTLIDSDLRLLFGCDGNNSSTCNGSYLNGFLDDVAIWNTPLTDDEIALIYSRQSAKYAGEMKSRIMDSQDASASWTNLDWVTTLPFGKELPGSSGSESSADYSNLEPNLMDGLKGLWHLNEKSLGGVVEGSDFIDSSGLGHHGEEIGGVGLGRNGIIGNSVTLDGVDDFILTGASNSILPGDTSFTLSAWIKPSSAVNNNKNVGGRIITIFRKNSSSKVALGLGWDGTDSIFVYDSSAVRSFVVTDTGVLDGNWHHTLTTYDAVSNTLKIYVDGVERFSKTTGTMSLTEDSTRMAIGSFSTSKGFFPGEIDEVSVWSRALHPSEITQLYRRGANRIKYQVRTCSSSDCSDQDALTGDGWKGPGGNELTYFSELYNNTSISSDCSIPQQCAANEISIDGDVKTESPSMRFDDFGADGIYLNNNRYFQYRVLMESDDENTACAGGTATCLPELKSVEIGPAHTYEEP